MTDPLAPGIYFDLPAEVYHDDPAISRSQLVALNDTPRTYWDDSFLNKDKKRTKKQNEAMEHGTAFHIMLFEPEKFESLYRLNTQKWIPNDGRKIIEYNKWYEMVEQIKVLKSGEHSGMFLTGGYPEVTIVFRDEATGLMFRTRHDYFGQVMSMDFKTTRTLEDWWLKREFSDRGYDIQFYLYRRARAEIKSQIRAGKAGIYGKVDKKFLDAFMHSDLNEFMFIFQRTTYPFPYEPVLPEDDTEQSGEEKFLSAQKVYIENLKKYGSSAWPVCRGKMRRFSMFYGFISNEHN